MLRHTNKQNRFVYPTKEHKNKAMRLIDQTEAILKMRIQKTRKDNQFQIFPREANFEKWQ